MSQTFGGITLAFRETVSCSFPATVTFESETFGFRGNVIKYRQFIGKLVKWKQGVFDSRC